MKFVHEDGEFQQLIAIVASDRRLSRGSGREDYWVTHGPGPARCGVRRVVKGGTSLSKGFQLIERFSEDLDLQIEPVPRPCRRC